MFRVRLWRDAGGRLWGFEGRGHVGLAPKGSDVVCAAASALLQTAAMGLTEHLKLPVRLEVRDGYLLCRLQDPPDAAAQAVLETLTLGLKEIERQYPRNVRVEELDEGLEHEPAQGPRWGPGPAAGR